MRRLPSALPSQDNPSRRALQTLKLRYHSYFAAPDEEQSTQQRYRNRAATIMVGAEDSGRGAGADGLPTATQYGGNKTKVRSVIECVGGGVDERENCGQTSGVRLAQVGRGLCAEELDCSFCERVRVLKAC